MTALIMDLALKFWPYIAAIGAALALLWQQRLAGAKAERAKQAEREAKARDIADQVDNDVGALPPEVVKKELGKWSR